MYAFQKPYNYHEPLISLVLWGVKGNVRKISLTRSAYHWYADLFRCKMVSNQKFWAQKRKNVRYFSLPRRHEPGAKGRENPVISMVWPLYLNLDLILLQLRKRTLFFPNSIGLVECWSKCTFFLTSTKTIPPEAVFCLRRDSVSTFQL